MEQQVPSSAGGLIHTQRQANTRNQLGTASDVANSAGYASN